MISMKKNNFKNIQIIIAFVSKDVFFEHFFNGIIRTLNEL